MVVWKRADTPPPLPLGAPPRYPQRMEHRRPDLEPAAAPTTPRRRHHEAPRCGARCRGPRAGRTCEAPGNGRGGRCKLHGGRSTGPVTAEGAERSRAGARVGGRVTAQRRAAARAQTRREAPAE